MFYVLCFMFYVLCFMFMFYIVLDRMLPSLCFRLISQTRRCNVSTKNINPLSAGATPIRCRTELMNHLKIFKTVSLLLYWLLLGTIVGTGYF